MTGATGLKPCSWTHLKKCLVSHSSGLCDGRQILLLRKRPGWQVCSNWYPREKKALCLSQGGKEFWVRFFFRVRVPISSGMLVFCFLSKVHRKKIIFIFIYSISWVFYFYFLCFCFFVFFLFNYHNIQRIFYINLSVIEALLNPLYWYGVKIKLCIYF